MRKSGRNCMTLLTIDSAQLGASVVILGCRNLVKGEIAKQEVVNARQSTKTDVQLWHIDMLSFDSVRSFAARLKELDRLDALVANAAIDVVHYKLAEGFESTLTVNVINTFLLGSLALPQLEATSRVYGPAHFTVVGSNIHYFSDHSQLQSPILKTLTNDQAKMPTRYFLSKLMVLQCLRQFAKGTDQVIVNCPSPGWCKTELFREDDGGFFGRNLLKLIGRTSEVGARNITAAIAADKSSHGQYFSECRVKPASVFVRSAEGLVLEKKVWAEVKAVIDRESRK